MLILDASAGFSSPLTELEAWNSYIKEEAKYQNNAKVF
jgi:hypothetical protein